MSKPTETVLSDLVPRALEGHALDDLDDYSVALPRWRELWLIGG